MDNELQLEDLAILKQQLREALGKVEAQEQVLEETLRPRTLDEIKSLEGKLTTALGDLRARKATLLREAPRAKR